MKSIRPYGSREAYLEAMEEDLAEWLAELHGVRLSPGPGFLGALETGLLLCRHADRAACEAQRFRQKRPKEAGRVTLPATGATCNPQAAPGSFPARDNVANFIHWCRQEMGIPEALTFETEDLVLRRNERHVVLCLLEVARRGARFGMRAPALVRMEEEIEEELRRDAGPAAPAEQRPLPAARREAGHFRDLDQMVQHLISRCTCPVQFSMVKVSEGKYRVGDSSALIFVRILRKHVMVRVGGGWDTLEHYLDKHDPCRCTSLSHKQALRTSSPQRTLATPVQHEVTARLTPRTGNTPLGPQPTALIVSRSQSPLPPVEWRSYLSPGLGSGWKVAAGPSGDSAGTDDRKKVTSGCVSQDHVGPWGAPSPGRIRERSTPPSGRWTSAEERPTLEQRGRSGTFHGSGQKDLPISRRRSSSLQAGLDSGREMAQSPAMRATSWGAATPPPSCHKEGVGCPSTRPSSPAKPLRASDPQARVLIRNGRRKDSKMQQRSSSPVPKTDALAAGEAGQTSYRPPTPSQSPRCRNGTRGPNGVKEEGKPDRSLEEEIMSGVKELEDGVDGKEVKTGEALGPGGFALGLERVCGAGQGVPRSGVFVPANGTRWPPIGGRYRDVIRELSAALNHGQTETGRAPDEREALPKAEESAGAKAAPSSAAGLEERSAPTEEPALTPNEPRRSLKKPERVPSIYKLKLRPKIRPRRDHRPERKPSRIPRPVGHGQRSGQRKALGPKALEQSEKDGVTKGAPQGKETCV